MYAETWLKLELTQKCHLSDKQFILFLMTWQRLYVLYLRKTSIHLYFNVPDMRKNFVRLGLIIRIQAMGPTHVTNQDWYHP